MHNYLQRFKDQIPFLSGKDLDLGSLTSLLAKLYQKRTALLAECSGKPISCTNSLSFIDIEQRVSRFAAAFQHLGVSKGSRVLVSTDNRFDLLLYIFALVRAGAIAVPVNPKLKPQEFSHVIEVSRSTLAIVDGDVAEKLIGTTTLPEHFRWIWTGIKEKTHAKQLFETNVSDWLRQHPGAKLPKTSRTKPEQTAVLLCTSGTTGKPKAAALTSRGLLSSAALFTMLQMGATHLGRERRDRIFAALPLTHVMGISAHLAALCGGIPLLHCHRFHAEDALRLIEKYEINAFIGVPTMYADLERADLTSYDLSRVQLWLSGADAMPPDRARRFQGYGGAFRLVGNSFGNAAFTDIYGMVELSGPMAVRLYPPTPHKRIELPAISVTLPGFEIRTVDEQKKPLGWGKTGQLQVKGVGVLQKYEGNPEASPDKEGWFSTGDLATTWPGGIFTLTGRKKDRLKVSGFSVFPAEVEAILRNYPKNLEVVVVGLPDERMGECPVALIQIDDLQEAKEWDESAFINWAKTEIAGYRRPRKAAMVPSIPRGNHGKIDRIKATQMAEAIWPA